MWNKKYEKCLKCGTIEIKHYAKGLCSRCYNVEFKKINYERERKNRKIWESKNRKKLCEYSIKYRKKRLEYSKNYNITHKEQIKERGKRYRKEHPEMVHRERKLHPEKYREQHRIEMFNKRKTNIHCKLRYNMSSAIWDKLKRKKSSKKGKGMSNYLSYSIEELIKHLETNFKEGMNWENYGDWHIDHIIPDCCFNYSSVDDEEFKKSWALTNLQPLWAKENLQKNRSLYLEKQMA